MAFSYKKTTKKPTGTKIVFKKPVYKNGKVVKDLEEVYYADKGFKKGYFVVKRKN